MLLRRRFGWSEESTRDPSSFAARGTHVGSRAAAELRRDPPALTLLRRQNAVRSFNNKNLHLVHHVHFDADRAALSGVQ
jgi:hypothetical protein